MKRVVSGSNRMCTAVCSFRRVVASLIVPPLLLISGAALAAEGRLSFSGSVANASCAVVQAGGATAAESTQRVTLSKSVTIFFDTSRNACAEQVIPFTASYESVPVASSRVQAVSPDAGVVILTYQ